MKNEDSLCWSCKRSDKFMHEGLFCSWAADFVPVVGWNAEPTQIISAEISEIINSFNVIECPLYTADRKKRKERKKEG